MGETLSKSSKWVRVGELGLSKLSVDDCKVISEADWPNLKEVSLSKSTSKQLEGKYKKMDFNIW